jgi:hypothetical protein
MHEYRVYFLDESGKIAGATWVETNSLEAAIVEVASKFPKKACEIWEGACRLTNVEPTED